MVSVPYTSQPIVATTSDITFNCPSCNQSLEAPPELFGQVIECPTCMNSIKVPMLDQCDMLGGEETPATDSNLPRYSDNSKTPKASVKQKQIAGIVGSALLFVGVFSPVVKLPFIGQINYLQYGERSGAIVLLLAIASGVLVLTQRFRLLWLTGGCSLGIIAYSYISFDPLLIESEHKMVTESDGNLFSQLGLMCTQRQWGFSIIFLGAILVIAAAAIPVYRKLSFHALKKNYIDMFLFVPPRQNTSGVTITNVKQGAIIGGWVCLGLGIFCMLLSLFTYFLYCPFFLVAFILSIVAMTQRKVLGGIMLLLATLIIPYVLGFMLIMLPFSNKKFAGDLLKSSRGSTYLLDKLDEKNGFQDIKLGTPLSQFSGLEPVEMLSKNVDEKNFRFENFNHQLGEFEISDIILRFEMGLLKDITVYAEGKQNIAGLKETLIKAYGRPEKEGISFDTLVWEGKLVKLSFNDADGLQKYAYASFTSKEVEAKIKAATEKRAKEGAVDATNQL